MNSWNLSSTLLLVVFACAALTSECSAAALAASLNDSALPAAGNVAKYPGADFGSRLVACIAALPSSGGVCDARGEGADLALSSDVIIEKPYTTIYLPHSSIQMGGHSIVVRAAAHGVSLIATAMHGRSTVQGQTRLRYSGTGCAIQVGDSVNNTDGFRMDDLFIDLTSSDGAASGLCITRTQDISILRPTVIGILASTNKQVLIKLDGSGNYTGGLIQQPFLNNGNVHMLFTGQAGTAQGANAVTVLAARSAGNGGSSVAVKIENGDGNSFLGGDFENMGTAFYLGGRAVINTFYGIRLEKNKEDFVMDTGSQHNMVHAPELRNYVDHGTQNTILLGQYTATATLTFETGSSPACADNTLRVDGASPGDTVSLGTPPPSPGGFFTAFVSAQNAVTVRYCSLLPTSSVTGAFSVAVAKR
jgi:hypothetical protein